MGEDATMVVERARTAFLAGKVRSIKQRRKILEDMLRMLNDKEDDLLQAMQNDLSKPRFETLLYEIDFCRNELLDALNNLEDWMKPQKVKKAAYMTLVPAFIQRQPYGVVLIIGTWNYPLQVTFGPMIGAIAAGNTVILKPSEISQEFAALAGKIVPQYFDSGCVQVVNGGVDVTTALLKEKMDYIMYTGSGGVAKVILQAAAKHLTPVTLELGGKSPCYVDDNVALRTMARRLVWSKMMNAGQTCIAPDYVICMPHMNAKLIHFMKMAIEDFYGQDPKQSSDYGRIISDRHFQHVLNLMTSSSGKIAIGGASDASQRYIEPTVLSNVQEQDPVMQEEIFGPVLPIYNVDTVDEAIAFINKRPKPLALYVLTNNKNVIKQFTEETSSGALVSNDLLLHASVETLPFGGVGDSGMGVYHGRFSFETFSHKRACLQANPGMEGLMSMRYPPFTQKKLNVIRWLVGKSRKNPFLRWTFAVAVVGLCAVVLYKVLGVNTVQQM